MSNKLCEFRCEFPKISFLRSFAVFSSAIGISLSAPPAVQLLVAVVPYLGHNSAYVRGSHSVFVGFGARIRMT